ncbi:hypothetical protein [Gynuella sp.]|uniref:hypothetical protein n=1 Tax=Gynuella sp. TaxID=2969146 RepID=UPI003D1337C0
MANIFVEAYCYHFETLYPLVNKFHNKDDILLHNKGAKGNLLFDAIEINKQSFSLFTLIKLLFLRKDIKNIYVNTVSMNLFARNSTVLLYSLQLLLIPYICKLFRKKVYGIIHEADQFYKTETYLSQRHKLFMLGYGQFHIKLYNGVYVLSHEVQSYLKKFGVSTDLLDTSSLANFVQTSEINKNHDEIRLAWIGAVDIKRRNWPVLLTLSKALLEKHNIRISLICDINACQGNELMSKLSEAGIASHFDVLEYRPDDNELLSTVAICDGIICFYADNSYGQVKTSGARHIANAFGSPMITYNNIEFKHEGHDGSVLKSADDLNVVLESLVLSYQQKTSC